MAATKTTKTRKATTKKATATKKTATGKREEARKRKEEEAAKARAAKIEKGDLIVVGKGKNEREFEKASKDTKALDRSEKILKAFDKANGTPLVLRDLAESLGAFYEEVLFAVAMLEAQGKVTRFETKSGKGRRAVAYRLND